MQIILASKSPRRKEIIQRLGITPIICTSHFDEAKTEKEVKERIDRFPFPCQEEIKKYEGAKLVPFFNALGKGLAVKNKEGAEKMILSADTIVEIEGEILGKPKDEEEAKEMLRKLSGKTHHVTTAAALFYKEKMKLLSVTTKVTFRTLTEEEIHWYVKTGEPMDKAGAYGIQGKGSILAEKIEGSYDNVVGLPLTEVYVEMTSWFGEFL